MATEARGESPTIRRAVKLSVTSGVQATKGFLQNCRDETIAGRLRVGTNPARDLECERARETEEERKR